jgi:hypothetical protein
MAIRGERGCRRSWHRLPFATQLDAAAVIRYQGVSYLSLRVNGGACS